MNYPQPFRIDEDRVLDFPTVAELLAVSLATLKRRIAAGHGPKVTRLSERRLGIRASHLREWLNKQEVTAA